uniref:Uncharacterized protein n=1 Tax=Anguilla anguilla TaxID=7936 RepID=A0A0E9T5K0_ANGAN
MWLRYAITQEIHFQNTTGEFSDALILPNVS